MGERKRSATPSPGPDRKKQSKRALEHHSESCRDCKTRVRELLERIYGTCVPNHKTSWPTDLDAYSGTPIETTLRAVAAALEQHRGFGVGDFVRTRTLAGCDYYVPDPGFLVEFDESQHFTELRKLALAAYRKRRPLGFSAKRWISLCDRHNATDNDPAFRDEQRAWYDTLRDLVPSIQNMQPTARLYARELVWCELDPDSRDDQKRFLAALRREDRLPGPIRTPARRPPSALRAAMVFPETSKHAESGMPPSGAALRQPEIPTVASFAGEDVDFVLFPEGYICLPGPEPVAKLRSLAKDLGAPLLVGATDMDFDLTGRGWQVLLRFDPDGTWSRIYTKHSLAEAVAFERPSWKPSAMLPTFDLDGINAGATICNDHYLGLLPRYLGQQGARLWVNPSFDNVTDLKWSSVLRLRAVENRFFALCTLHCDITRHKTHPFAFSPDGLEIAARKAGSDIEQPLSQCTDAGSIYIVDLDMSEAGKPLDWSNLPPCDRQRVGRGGKPWKPVRVALRRGMPAPGGAAGWTATESGFRLETSHGPVYVGIVDQARLLDPAACFRVIDAAKKMGCAPVIWNHWQELPTASDRLATLLMGRAIECCAPIMLSDKRGIHELVELANKNKVPVRRIVDSAGQVTLDVCNAWGLDSAFKMVASCVPPGRRELALDRYRQLA